MQTSVTVWFWILDIVLSLDQSDIILLTYFFRKRIDIFRKTADHTDTCNITDIFFYGLYTDLYIFLFIFSRILIGFLILLSIDKIGF